MKQKNTAHLKDGVDNDNNELLGKHNVNGALVFVEMLIKILLLIFPRIFYFNFIEVDGKKIMLLKFS